MAETLTTIRTHYRICMEMNPEWEKEQEKKKWTENIFSPLSLKHLCRGVVVKKLGSPNNLPQLKNATLPKDIREYLEDDDDLSIFEFSTKSARQGVDDKSLAVGNFAEYKSILHQPSNFCFSTNLRAQAKAVIKYDTHISSSSTLFLSHCLGYSRSSNQ
jgi:hypothetical protein